MDFILNLSASNVTSKVIIIKVFWPSKTAQEKNNKIKIDKKYRADCGQWRKNKLVISRKKYNHDTAYTLTHIIINRPWICSKVFDFIFSNDMFQYSFMHYQRNLTLFLLFQKKLWSSSNLIFFLKRTIIQNKKVKIMQNYNCNVWLIWDDTFGILFIFRLSSECGLNHFKSLSTYSCGYVCVENNVLLNTIQKQTLNKWQKVKTKKKIIQNSITYSCRRK